MRCDMNVFLVRQIFLEIAVCLISYTTGINLAFPSVLNPAILEPDANIKITPHQLSWLATCLGIGGMVGFGFTSTVFEVFGRKPANIMTNVTLLVGSLILYTANNVYSIALARATQGLSMGGAYLCIIALGECVSPKRRGYFLVLNKVALGLGSLSCHSLDLIFNWRQIALFLALGNLISIIIFIFSAESPSFLAMRGQFSKSVETFEWYRGYSLNAKKELKQLISAQTERMRMKERGNKSSTCKKIMDIVKTTEFQKSLSIATLATLCLDSCGRYFLIAYSNQILIELTNSTTLSMYMSIAIDLILILAFCISSVMVKYFKRRTLLFNLGYSSVFFMFMISFSIILGSKLNWFHDMNWLTPVILFIHTFITNIGLVPTAFALSGEIFSTDQRGLGSCLSSFLFLIFFNLVMFVTPMMIEKTGVAGTYFVYGSFLLIFLVLLQVIVPETKDKTLQEIEDEIRGIVRNTSEIELSKLTEGANR